jgi:hypothetical protein
MSLCSLAYSISLFSEQLQDCLSTIVVVVRGGVGGGGGADIDGSDGNETMMNNQCKMIF